jgi:Fur family transcriptional regulator, ferric uptake regulator
VAGDPTPLLTEEPSLAKGQRMPTPGATGEFRSGDPESLKERWRAYLADKKLNITSQREAIVDQFLRTEEHISIEELLARVRRRHARVGYATVYRTLKLLVDSGLAIERHFGDGQSRYEVAGDHHDHLICAACGLILEFEDDEIEALQEKIAQRLGGFTVVRHRHELYGLCPKARGVEGGYCPSDAAARGRRPGG